MNERPRILCVDDREELRRNVKQQFEDEDFVVDTAEDGQVALEKIKNTDYDIVLLDVDMPKLDGISVLREMKSAGRLTNVIMLPGMNEVAIALACVKIGAKDYISKPYDPEELLTIVNRTLGL